MRGSARPEVSVVVVTLNEGAYLRQTVEHLRASLPARSEIIVVDDGSTDGSVEALAGIPGRECRVIPVEGDVDSGSCAGHDSVTEQPHQLG